MQPVSEGPASINDREKRANFGVEPKGSEGKEALQGRESEGHLYIVLFFPRRCYVNENKTAYESLVASIDGPEDGIGNRTGGPNK